MKINSFYISNFKGIQSTKIEINSKTDGDVITLIGLNESGKTTILEALSRFLTRDKYASSLIKNEDKDSTNEFIPKHSKAAFSGKISINAIASVDESDRSALAAMYLEKYQMVLDRSKVPDQFSLETVYNFEDSRFIGAESVWEIEFHLRHKTKKKYIEYRYREDEKDYQIWSDGCDVLADRMPRIVYFPTFLFDIPERIYLYGKKDNITQYYNQIIQDILDNSNSKLNIQKHVIDRIERIKTSNKQNQSLYALLLASDEKKQIDAVIQQLANEIGKIVFGSWNEILGRNVSGKRIGIDWFLDSDQGNVPYIEMYIVDGQSRYSISERSLGFRWFFAFLLFTQFRKNRPSGEKTIFLFDEPASNLHSKAQIKLLETFDKIVKSGTSIIYSTHSHYMINPLWLESAYIVRNEAADYDRDDEIDSFEIVKTDIKAVRYRNFVGSNPTKTTYFQPALDALDVSFSPLLRAESAVIIEGKYDFPAFYYFMNKKKFDDAPDIFPATGAGNMAVMVSLLRGWGVEFKVLLDDDQAGRREKKRYINERILLENEVFTLGDIIPELKEKSFESIYQNDVIDDVKEYYSVNKVDKRHFATFFQNKLLTKHKSDYNETDKIFESIRIWLKIRR
ncbi:AAA family ATPase [uncultured Bosea sp.]|uniref:ATP-dependent nuclease n=1 Tax=uncultured Bosea sp. TaxID=211457 RepID=UPI002600EDDE|nr:AAA family ATPase [uncultured Bosea sp.]